MKNESINIKEINIILNTLNNYKNSIDDKRELFLTGILNAKSNLTEFIDTLTRICESNE